MDNARPMMALCTELQDRYGLLIAYEDAPTDPISDTASEVRSNGGAYRFPRSTAITFHVPPNVVTRSDSSAPVNGAVDLDISLRAVQALVDEYNASGNPGRFTALADGRFIHIEETMRSVGGKLQPFEPVSNSVLTWTSESASCQKMLVDLSSALQKQRGVGIAEGVMPMGAMLTHSCTAIGTELTVRQVLEAIMNGLDIDRISGHRARSFTWHLVYDPNWRKYFLNIYGVVENRPARSLANSSTGVGAQTAVSSGTGRLGKSPDGKPK